MRTGRMGPHNLDGPIGTYGVLMGPFGPPVLLCYFGKNAGAAGGGLNEAIVSRPMLTADSPWLHSPCLLIRLAAARRSGKIW